MNLIESHKEYKVLSKLLKYFNVHIVGTYRAVLNKEYDYNDANDIDILVNEKILDNVVEFLTDEGYIGAGIGNIKNDKRYGQHKRYKYSKEGYKSIDIIVENTINVITGKTILKPYREWIAELATSSDVVDKEKLIKILNFQINNIKNDKSRDCS
jgi:hypothetical protein